MDVTFLGTSAANAYPEAFCRCANCERARALGGRSIRKRSAVLINNDLLIDFGPDIMTASIMHDRPLYSVCYCLQTHAHEDHLDTSFLAGRGTEWELVGVSPLHFYASPGSLRLAAQRASRDCAPFSLLDKEIGERFNMQFHHVEAGQFFNCGPYGAIAFAANHDPTVEPLLYAVEGEGRTVFYGVDTAALPEETWRAFHRHNLRFDLVILDHTYGTDREYPDHLNARQFADHLSRLREEGLLAEKARAFATHIWHNNQVYPDLVDYAAQRGYEIAYDGLTVRVGEA